MEIPRSPRLAVAPRGVFALLIEKLQTLPEDDECSSDALLSYKLLCHFYSNDKVAVNAPSISSEQERVLCEDNVQFIPPSAFFLFSRVALANSSKWGNRMSKSDEQVEQQVMDEGKRI